MEHIWVGIVLVGGIYINLFGLWLYRKPTAPPWFPTTARWAFSSRLFSFPFELLLHAQHIHHRQRE